MKPEDKELLLTDLCARVPYHPKGHVVNACNGAECDEWLTCATFTMFTNVTNNCRLYLRPMSSMTDKEMEELLQTSGFNSDVDEIYDDFIVFIERTSIDIIDIVNFISWLNIHHFDYRGLIAKGLALEAPEGMYNV